MSTHDLTRRQLLEYTGLAAMVALIPQPFSAASSPSNTNQNTVNETWFGQYQLRGSILVIKDNQVSASGFIAFGTDMTTIPTSPTTGTGVYQDYRGIYGLNAGTQQFYLQSSDGKAYAGGGVVTLDANGIAIAYGASTPNLLRWTNGSDTVAYLSASAATYYGLSINANGYFQNGVGSLTLNAFNDAAVSSTLYLTSNASVGYATFYMSGAGTYRGVAISDVTSVLPVPSSLLELYSTAPTFRMTDTTASAKSLLVTTNANLSTFQEAAGANILTLDLANARAGIGNASPAVALDVTGEIRASSRLRVSGSTTALVQQNRITLANNATAQLSVGNAANIAFVVISCSSGDTGIFVTKGGANTASLISAGGGSFTATATTAGNTNVYWNTPTNTRYEIENKTGSSRNYDILEFAVG